MIGNWTFGFLVGLWIGAIAGFFTCALLTVSKISALQDQLNHSEDGNG